MTWFMLTGDTRLGRCATEGCGGQPTFRLEADGVGSNYCSGCKANIEWDAGEHEGCGKDTERAVLCHKYECVSKLNHHRAGEIERLRGLLYRLRNWASRVDDWRPDARLGREISAALEGYEPRAAAEKAQEI